AVNPESESESEPESEPRSEPESQPETDDDEAVDRARRDLRTYLWDDSLEAVDDFMESHESREVTEHKKPSRIQNILKRLIHPFEVILNFFLQLLKSIAAAIKKPFKRLG